MDPASIGTSGEPQGLLGAAVGWGMMGLWLNSIGLVLDIVGAIILFKYGLPENINRKGEVGLVTGETDAEEVAKAELYDRWGRVGLILLILGFALQLIGNWV
jgi:hypothetical protein